MNALTPEAFKNMKALVKGPNFAPQTLTFGEVKCYQYNKSLKDELTAARLTRDDAIFMYKQMLDIRAFESTIIKLRSGELVPFEGYKFSGATHLSIGQEAVAAGANAAIRATDYITSSHRGHGHSIAKESYALRTMADADLKKFINDVGPDALALIKNHFGASGDTPLDKALDVHIYRTMAEFMGKQHGYCKGKGGGMHIADFNVGHLGANAIVGGSIPIAAGAGIGQMLQQQMLERELELQGKSGKAQGGASQACQQERAGTASYVKGSRQPAMEGGQQHGVKGTSQEKQQKSAGAAGQVSGWGEGTGSNRGTAGGEGKVVLCFFGDGACNNGVFGESMNLSCMGQFKRGVPVIYLIENNQFGMTGRAKYEINGIDQIARRGWAYNEVGMHAEVVNGMNALAVRDAVLRAAELCRKGEGPVLLEAMTYRYMGHSLSDQNTYRAAEEIEAWRCEDAIEGFKAELVKANVLGPEEVDVLEKQQTERMEKITVAAANGPFPEPSTIMDGLYSDTTSDGIGDEFATVDYDASAIKDYRDNESRIPYRRAILEAMTEEMVRDKRVVFYGEDVAEMGGAFAATAGLLETFGRGRVFNAPISEATICGAAVGMAMTGLRPVCELMYIDFILMSMDQLGNQAAKNKYMFGGKAKIPMVCRTTIGGGKGYAGQHSQSLEAVPAGVPGLKVVLPSTAADAKGMLKAAIRDDNPVMFIEHQLLYGEKGVVPRGEHIVPLGKAAIRREGTDVTIMAYSYMAVLAEKAGEMLAAKGVSAEVIDVRSLVPLDEECLINSLKKTNYGCVVSQAPGTGCFGEHIINVLQRKAFDYLDGPIELVAAYDCPPPMAPTLEEEFMPSAEKITRSVLELLNKS